MKHFLYQLVSVLTEIPRNIADFHHSNREAPKFHETLFRVIRELSP